MSTGFSILSAQSSTLRQDMANRKGNRTGWTPVQKSRWFLSAIVIGLFGSIMSEPKPGQRSSVFGFSRFIWGLVIVGQAENARWRVRGTGFEPPERRSLCSLVPCFESSAPICGSRVVRRKMRGTGFEPDGDGRPHFVRPLRLPGFAPVLLFAHFVRSCAGPDSNRRTPTG